LAENSGIPRAGLLRFTIVSRPEDWGKGEPETRVPTTFAKLWGAGIAKSKRD